MSIEIREQSLAALADYARVSIAFDVRDVFDVAAGPAGAGFILSARRLPFPYVKDYDAVSGERPTQWSQLFDVSTWGCFSAFIDDQCVGGATVARNNATVDMLEGRTDLAVLWDIRVAPSTRRRGVGSALFDALEAWAFAKACRELKVETQNVNTTACRFYERQGCVLRAAHRGMYPAFPDEIQLLWYKNLARR